MDNWIRSTRMAGSYKVIHFLGRVIHTAVLLASRNCKAIDTLKTNQVLHVIGETSSQGSMCRKVLSKGADPAPISLKRQNKYVSCNKKLNVQFTCFDYVVLMLTRFGSGTEFPLALGASYISYMVFLQPQELLATTSGSTIFHFGSTLMTSWVNG
jgi:hypothetical protein